MEKKKHNIQFEAIVGKNETISFSKSVSELKLQAGSSVTVKIICGTLSKQLSSIGVSEEEIEIIGNTQLEERENVVRFLSSQGKMKNNGAFVKRAMLIK